MDVVQHVFVCVAKTAVFHSRESGDSSTAILLCICDELLLLKIVVGSLVELCHLIEVYQTQN